jgi:hypothetical protein
MDIGSAAPIPEQNEIIVFTGTPVPAMFDKRARFSFQGGIISSRPRKYYWDS